MQSDIHFYGTYVLSRAAGIPREDAHTIAYASQFVDDSTGKSSEAHPDGGLLVGIATAHHEFQCLRNGEMEPDEQRRVRVPFHFLPGGKGETLEERLLCVKDSKIAREMIEHHIEAALRCPSFRMELLGIAAHVYMDTFSHYGFSGVGSKYNAIKWESVALTGVRDLQKAFALDTAECLGNAGVPNYPDRPFLHWRFTFKKDRPNNGAHAVRNNPLTYLESCEKMHKHLSSFARRYYAESVQQNFGDFRDSIEAILRFEGQIEGSHRAVAICHPRQNHLRVRARRRQNFLQPQRLGV